MTRQIPEDIIDWLEHSGRTRPPSCPFTFVARWIGEDGDLYWTDDGLEVHQLGRDDPVAWQVYRAAVMSQIPECGPSASAEARTEREAFRAFWGEHQVVKARRFLDEYHGERTSATGGSGTKHT